jgi:hypothetical protein
MWEAVQGMQSNISSLGFATKSGRKEFQESSTASKGASATVKTLALEFVAMGQDAPILGYCFKFWVGAMLVLW